MRRIPLILAILILLLQYPLWFGKGGWLKMRELEHELETQKQVNRQTQSRNAVLDAEVRDLKQGNAAIEERARSGLGMIKQGEVFYQIDGFQHVPAASSAASAVTVNANPASNH